MLVVGIDPGLDGAIALYSPGAALLSVHDMPTLATGKGAAGRTVNGRAIHDLLYPYRAVVTAASVEQVGGVGKQSAARSFQFGLGTGIVHGVLHSLGIGFTLVPPQTWKRHFGLKRQAEETDSHFKARSRAVATQRFPLFSEYWPLAKHDGRAEAFLIAVYKAESINA